MKDFIEVTTKAGWHRLYQVQAIEYIARLGERESRMHLVNSLDIELMDSYNVLKDKLAAR